MDGPAGISEEPLSSADLEAKILEMMKAGIGTEVIVGYAKGVKVSGRISAEQIVEAGIPDAVLGAAVSR